MQHIVVTIESQLMQHIFTVQWSICGANRNLLRTFTRSRVFPTLNSPAML